MDDLACQTRFHERGGCDGAGRQENMDLTSHQFLDQRNDGIGFTDTCRMDPDQRPARPWLAGMAEPLQPTSPVFLALESAIGKIGDSEGIGADSGQPVRQKGCLRHAAPHLPHPLIKTIDLIAPQPNAAIVCCQNTSKTRRKRHPVAWLRQSLDCGSRRRCMCTMK